MINSPRINTICSLVTGKIVAEIGCDHAYITKNLFLQNKIDYAILTDISEKCLQKAVTNLAEYKNKTLFKTGNGVQALKDINNTNIQEVIIAGMGGQEIIKILSDPQAQNYTNFVLQPQKNVTEVRNFLQQNNYKILQDEIVQEGKLFYFVLKVKKTSKQHLLNPTELYFGNPQNKQALKNYLNYELTKRKQISQKKKVLDNELLISVIECYLQNLNNE